MTEYIFSKADQVASNWEMIKKMKAGQGQGALCTEYLVKRTPWHYSTESLVSVARCLATSFEETCLKSEVIIL